MRQHFKLYFVVSLLAVFLSAWTVQSAKSARTTDEGTSVESSQANAPVGTVSENTSSDGSTVGIPSLEERDTILNGVNLSPPIDRTTTGNVAGPLPGTESGGAGSVIPVPAQTISNNGSPSIVGVPTEKVINETIKLLSDWLSAFLRSIFSA
jgi:hypothetical protein